MDALLLQRLDVVAARRTGVVVPALDPTVKIKGTVYPGMMYDIAGAEPAGVNIGAVARAVVAPSKTKDHVDLEKLEKHRKAVAMIAGLWGNSEEGPIDGVEYQKKMREAW
ncbi:hypothetical protein GTP58_30355 [Duganella sp. CY15W]|nr:hypothetical protein [Duganella sp. CY15W]